MRERVDPAAETPAAALDDALHGLCRADAVWAERYDGWEELGRGGSARVVKVKSRSAGEIVALKIFPHLDADDVRRFQREVRSAQRLASPFVVRTFSPFLRRGLAWIEMEWVDGPNLRQALERRAAAADPLPTPEAVAIASCVVRAVSCAHEEGVIHRDVKPANVLLPAGGSPRAKLGDFGISRIAGSTRATATGLLPGTPQFVAPEVVSGQEADAAADVYSLCLTLHRLFAGGRSALPVAEDATPAQWLRAQTEQAPVPLRRHDPTRPAVLEGLLLRGLAKDPKTRPSADEILAVLESIADRPAATARTAAPRFGARAPVRAFVLGALGGGLLVLAATAPRSPARPVAVTPAPSPTAMSVATAASPPAPTASLERPPLRLSARTADSISLENRSGEALQSVRVTLLAATGTRHVAALSSLAAGEELTLGFAAFDPIPAAALHLRAVEITARTAQGPTALTLDAARAPQ